jgi:ABC-type nitrate/sulfonate/bicarbonate transport system permease component
MLNSSDNSRIATRLTATRPDRISIARSIYRKYEHSFLGALGIAIFLALWELLPALGLVRPLFTSSPSRVLVAAKWLIANGLWNDIIISGTEFGIGFILAVLVAVPSGVLLGWYRGLHAFFDPLITMCYVTPRVALFPLLILWLGIGLTSKIAVIFLGAVFPILINVIAGMRTIDQTLLMCARSFGATKRQIFTTLALPSSIPFTLAGLRIGLGRALVGMVVGEMVASTGGVGHMMSTAGQTFQTDKVFVGIILIAAFGYALTAILNKLERRFECWRPQRS